MQNAAFRATPRSPIAVLVFLGIACAALSPARAGADRWTDLAVPGSVSAVAADPRDAATVRAATFGGELHTSTDGGATWTASRPGSADPGSVTPRLYSLLIHPGNGSIFVGADYGRVYLTQDGGSTWFRYRIDQGAGSTQTINALQVSGNKAMAGTSNGVWLNSEVFAHPGDWRIDPAWDQGGAIPAGCRRVYAVAAEPPSGVPAYAGTDCGLYKFDLGSWQKVEGLSVTVHSIVIDPELADIVYAGTDQGVFRVTNGGAAAAAIGGGFPIVAVDPTDTSIIYGGSPGQGVYKGNPDGPGAWLPFNAGMGAQGINALAVSPKDPHRLYAVVAGGDLYGITQTYLPTAPRDLAVGYSIAPPWSVSLKVNAGRFRGTATVRSLGPADASGAKFRLAFQKPSGLRMVDAWADLRVIALSASPGSCVVTSTTATCSLGAMPANATATVSFTVEPEASLANVPLTTSAEVVGATVGDLWGMGEAATANNATKATTTVGK